MVEAAASSSCLILAHRCWWGRKAARPAATPASQGRPIASSSSGSRGNVQWQAGARAEHVPSAISRTCRELHAGPGILGERLLVHAEQLLPIGQAPHLQVAVGCKGVQGHGV